MIAAITTLMLAQPFPPAPPVPRPYECATDVLLEWGRHVRSVQGRTGTATELRQLSLACEGAGRRHDIDPDFLRAIAWVESHGRPQSISPAGARGPFQIMIRTARGVFAPGTPSTAIRPKLHSATAAPDIAAMVLLRMARKWGNRALTVYTCGLREVCRRRGKLVRWTRAARAYFRVYRLLQREAAACRAGRL